MTAYPLESTDRERDRLERQARVQRPFTERLLRAAGAKPGAAILDLGTGAGDVALLAAELVGPSGRVVTIDRDAANLERARARIAALGITNVACIEGDIAEPPEDQFDLSIGRFVLMYQADPVAVVCAVARVVRPGGAVAFHEMQLHEGVRGDSFPAAPQAFVATMMKLAAAMHRRVQNSLGSRLPSIMSDAGLDVSGWHFEISAPVVTREDAIVLMPGIMRTFTPLAVADGTLRPDEVDADALERWWRSNPEYAAMVMPSTVLGWARKPA
jgi:ubiquinone/menaquinone biosynthesis C-methylase UbiE